MDIDLRQRTLTLRILYAGPERATKFLNLRRLQAAMTEGHEALHVLRADGGRVVKLPFGPQHGDKVFGLDVRWVAMAAPGHVEAPAVERLLLQAADAVVFLPARDDQNGPGTQRALTRLVDLLKRGPRRWRPLPVVVQSYADSPRGALVESLAGNQSLEAQEHTVTGDREECVKEVFGTVRESLLKQLRQVEAQHGTEGGIGRLRQGGLEADHMVAAENADERPTLEVEEWAKGAASKAVALGSGQGGRLEVLATLAVLSLAMAAAAWLALSL